METSFPQNSGTWKMKVCKTTIDVLADLLTDYKIEYVENVPNSFSTYWSMKLLAKFMGLQQTYLTGNFSFLLVKHNRYVKHVEMGSIPHTSPVLNARLAEASQNITVGDGLTVFDFITHFGSHYVHSFSAGSVLYQVSFSLSPLLDMNV